MITEQRKQYIKSWKEKNRDRVYAAHREWYKNNRDKPYYLDRGKNKIKPGEEYGGTSGLGRKYERIANTMLSGSKLSDSFQSPFDLEWNGMNIDVKMRNKNKHGSYIFTKKKKCTADYFLCFCVDNSIRYILLIPKNIFGNALNVTEKKVETILKKYLFVVK